MHKDFFVELLSGNPPLFQAVLAFNGLIETQQGPLPPDFEESPVVRELWASPAVRRRYPQPTATATLPPFWDFSEESRRLALLPAAVLKHLANTFGATLHGETIAHTLWHQDVTDIRQGLGKTLYDYVLHRGRYQTGNAMRQFFLTRNQELPLAEKVRLHGQLALEACCAVWPEALRMHAGCHLGEALPFLNADKPLDAEKHKDMPPADMLWLDLKKLLLKEVAPQWAHYFN